MADNNSATSSWRSDSFRDNIVGKLNAHIVALDMPLKMDAQQMEKNIYQKARSEHEYLAYIARLLVYIRDKSRLEAAKPVATDERSAIEEEDEGEYAADESHESSACNQLQQSIPSACPAPPPPPPPLPPVVIPCAIISTASGASNTNQRRPEPNAAQKLDILKTAIATVLQNPAWRCDPATIRSQVQLFGQYVAAQLAQIEDEELLVSTQQKVMSLLNKAV